MGSDLDQQYPTGDPGAVLCRACGAGRYRQNGALVCRVCDGPAHLQGPLTPGPPV